MNLSKLRCVKASAPPALAGKKKEYWKSLHRISVGNSVNTIFTCMSCCLEAAHIYQKTSGDKTSRSIDFTAGCAGGKENQGN